MKSRKLTSLLVMILSIVLCLGSAPAAYAVEFSGEDLAVQEMGSEDFEEVFSDVEAFVETQTPQEEIVQNQVTELQQVSEIVMEESQNSDQPEDIFTDEEIFSEEVLSEETELFATDSDETIMDEIADEDAADETVFEFAYVNPLYSDVIDEESLLKPEENTEGITYVSEYSESGEVSLFSSNALRTRTVAVPVYNSIETAGTAIRESMKNRESTVRYQYTAADGSALTTTSLIAMMDYALLHTGNPIEGDYLKFQFAGFRATISSTNTVTWTITYYTSAEQEMQMNQAVAELLSNLKLAGKSNYEKVSAVYDYLCCNVKYDYTNLNDDSYKLKYTGYAALINKTSVCQGYAVLMYRLLLEYGIDCRVVAGSSFGEEHSWNIVRLGGNYYYLDATWDAGYLTYNYFLKCEANFLNHNRSEEYASESFCAQYPIGSTDYTVQPSDITASVQHVENGVVYNIANGSAAVIGYQGTDSKIVIPERVNGVLVSSISDYSFCNQEKLKMIWFAGNAPAIEALAFYGVEATVVYPAENSTWTDNLLQNYGGIIQWTAHGENVHSWSAWVITKETSYEAAGEQERRCSLCEKKETEAIAKKVLATPTVEAKELDYNKVQINWSAVEDASGYRVYRKPAGGSWVRLKTLSDENLTYTDKTVVVGTKYYYSVRAYCVPASTKVYGKYGYSKAVKTLTNAPKLVSVKSSSYNKIKIAWEKVSGASGYRVYRKEAGGSWQKLANVSSSTVSYTDSKAVTGVTYYYTVRSHRIIDGTKIWGRYDKTGLKGKAVISAPTLVSAQIVSSKKTTITWKKVSGASGYRIYVKNADGSWTKIKTVAGSATSYTYTKAKGKSQTYTVRAYRNVNGKAVWGSYSKTGIKSKK